MKRSLTILLTLFALTMSALGITTPAIAADATRAADLPSVAEFLNVDGTLKLSAGYSGNLDITNYTVTLDPARGPLFSPTQTLTPNAWNALGTGLNNTIFAIAISGTDVYAGGHFTDAGGDTNADYIAKWNGSTWSPLGTGLNNTVYAIAISGTDVYAGGHFTNAGDDPNADKIAKWNGSAWSALGITPLSSVVFAIAVSGTDVYAGGEFTDAGGDTNADYIAKWNGSTWSALGTTPLNFFVWAIAISGTDVYVGGGFANAGGDTNADHIAKWNGSTWSALSGTPMNNSVFAIVISGTDVYVGGAFTDVGGDTNADYLAKWNGSAWSALGATPLNSNVRAIAISGVDVYAIGYFSDAGGDVNADLIAKWNGSAWSALGGTAPLNQFAFSIATSGADVYAGGDFTNAGGDANADKIAVFGGPDITAPIVDTFTATTPSSSLAIPITAFTASDDAGVTGYLVTESSTIPGAGDSGWSGTAPTTYTVGSDGNYTLYPWAKDAAGNVSAVFGSPVSVTVDTIAPTVLSSVRVSASPTNLSSVNFTVTFSESVTGVGMADFTLTTTGVTGASITGVTGTGPYTVSVNTGSGNGSIRLDVLNDGTIKDAALNPLAAAFTSGESYAVNKAATFGDTPLTYWASSFIERLYNAGITGGCSVSPLQYCPENTVTRDQMAIFLERGIHGPSFTPPNVIPTFGDTAGNFAEDWIEALKNDGITGGCGNGNYCPGDAVTRAQMAIFLERSMHGSSFVPPNVAPTFGDTAGNFAEDWIEALKNDGITTGCGNGNYCPDDVVTRAQMAVFLVKAFNLP